MVLWVVLVGLLAAVAMSAVTGVDTRSLPGVALGSPVLVVAERAAALFALWLAVLVVLVQARRGRLPTEVSGRGVRYADGDAAEEALRRVEAVAVRHDHELEAIRTLLLRLDGSRIERIE